jgi:hypothetical protein
MAFPVELSDAARLIEETDDDERDARAGRLVELSDLLGSRPLALHGLAADWLFEDVKATWLYGYFTGTVLRLATGQPERFGSRPRWSRWSRSLNQSRGGPLAAYAFCIQQLAGFVRTMPDVPAISDDAITLEVLAEIAHQRR